MLIFMRTFPKDPIEGPLSVVISCNQSQFSGCHDDNSNRVATSEHVRFTEACLEYESSLREILKVVNNDFQEKYIGSSD